MHLPLLGGISSGVMVLCGKKYLNLSPPSPLSPT